MTAFLFLNSYINIIFLMLANWVYLGSAPGVGVMRSYPNINVTHMGEEYYKTW
jgi:hypothetical protein